MKILSKPSGSLGRRLHCPIAYFNTENILFSDTGIKSDAAYAERIKVIKHKQGLRIKAKSFDAVYHIEIDYSELVSIRITEPDIYDMPKRDRSAAADVIFGWVSGLSSLHNHKLKIGGSIEFMYSGSGSPQSITLCHSKQDVFDLFKYISKHFSEYILDN